MPKILDERRKHLVLIAIRMKPKTLGGERKLSPDSVQSSGERELLFL